MQIKKSYFIRNAKIVNEGEIFEGSVLVRDEIIEKIYSNDDEPSSLPEFCIEIDATGKHLIPGVIDDQVHFRDPGLTHKGDIYSESKAAVAGGITSFMDMPNTNPPALTQDLLKVKYEKASENSMANYSFYMGASNDNVSEVLKTNPKDVCGVKIFLGSSTGEMLVDNPETLKEIFEKSDCLIAVHAEDDGIINANLESFREEYGEDIPIEFHPEIRSEEACYESSSFAVQLAKKYGTRLHVLHISTARELGLFDNQLPVGEKQITAEVCVHHLWFTEEDYQELGTKIKWNPAIKTSYDQAALLEGVKMDIIDVIATDHAPHLIEEKKQVYTKSPSGGPMVQHSLVAMLEFYHKGKLPIWKIVEKMCHAPSLCFKIEKRGFIREGYYADLVLVDLNQLWIVERSNILYKCKWSPLEGLTFSSQVTHTFVNGILVYEEGSFEDGYRGKRLTFEK